MGEIDIEKKRKKSQVDGEGPRKKKKNKKSSSVEKLHEHEPVVSDVNTSREKNEYKTIKEDGGTSDCQDDELNMIGNDDVREMKKQKKEKMSKKKEEKKKQKEISKTAVEGESIDPVQKCIQDSLAYLHNWRDNRSQWKFQKKRQTWLLKHMYDTKIVSDDDFNTVLEYIGPLQGSSRTLTLHQAEGYATVHDSNASDSEESDGETEDKTPKAKKGWMNATQLDRVKQVIQLLS